MTEDTHQIAEIFTNAQRTALVRAIPDVRLAVAGIGDALMAGDIKTADAGLALAVQRLEIVLGVLRSCRKSN